MVVSPNLTGRINKNLQKKETNYYDYFREKDIFRRK